MALGGGFGRWGFGKVEYAEDEETREAEEEQEGFDIVVHGRLSDCEGEPGERWRHVMLS